MLNTNRKYRVVYLDREDVYQFDCSLNDLSLNTDNQDLKDTELLYSLQEQTDKIMDLELFQHNTITIHRDNKEKGLIIRIQ